MAIAVLVGTHAKSSVAAQQQTTPAESKAASGVSVPAPSQFSTSAPVFDVAAIHPHIPDPHEHNSIWSSPGDGRFRAENVSVVMLIHWAYEMPETRILNAPGWAGTTYFNIDATADPSILAALQKLTSDAGRRQKEKMVQALLADRFKLSMHAESRELPIYTLVVAKGGPKLGVLRDSGATINRGSDRIEVQTSNSVSTLAEQLSMIVGRDVVDQTAITGRYNLKLQWTPDDAAADSGPSIFTALEEQLGLKLEPAKGPVQVLVIDKVEMPSAN
jgi:uncharacterized protein (TIGR03435 family)